MIKEWLLLLVQPDFLQGMMMAVLFFLLPLHKKPHWKRNFVLLAAVFLLIEVPITSTQLFGWNQPISYLCPVLFPIAAFLLCSQSTLLEAVYGMSCAYAAQHIAFCAVVILRRGEPQPSFAVIAWGVHLIVFALLWKYVATKLPYEGKYAVSLEKTVLTAGLIIFIALFLSYNSRDPVLAMSTTNTYKIYMASELLSCLFLLLIQTEQRREAALMIDMETERRLRLQMKAQYQLSRENIDLINRKSHDLKHQIAALRLVHDAEEREAGLREMENAVQIYDSSAQTGNEVLDTLLTEKGFLCQKDKILWTHMADGRGLDFISPVDLYTLLGNALDNAIESCREVSDPQQRVVRFSARQSHGVAFFQIENYYEHPIQLVDGMPQTTKPDVQNHGFGMKSIRVITEQYGGTMNIEVSDKTFLLTILIPLKSSERP